jgi:5'-methylthioadenosine/S-adenosylhomocysteine nucleosidase
LSGIGLVVALPREIPAGFVRIDNRQSTEPQTCALYRSAPAAAGHMAVQAGVGRERAAAGARLLIRRFSPHALVSFGFAGGLTPELARGTLVIGTQVVGDDSSGRLATANDDLVRQVQRAAEVEQLPARQGLIVTTRQIVADSASKTEWWEKSGACAVDMETAGIAEVAHEAGLPWVAVRAIVDSAADSLPAACLSVLGEDGHVASRRLVQALCRSPQLLWPFLRLASDMRTARRHLSLAFERWAKSLAG